MATLALTRASRWIYLTASMLCLLLVMGDETWNHADPFTCELNREQRAMIEIKAIEMLQRNGFSLVESGGFAFQGTCS